jgi:hypothetical protein
MNILEWGDLQWAGIEITCCAGLGLDSMSRNLRGATCCAPALILSLTVSVTQRRLPEKSGRGWGWVLFINFKYFWLALTEALNPDNILRYI